MKSFLGFVFMLIVALVSGCAVDSSGIPQTIIDGGTIADQTWTAEKSPYVIRGDVSVPAGSFLSIQPGTVVLFASEDATGSGTDPDKIEFRILGELDALGTGEEPILFQAQEENDSYDSWYGLFLGNSETPALLKNVGIRDAEYGLYLGNSGAVDLTFSVIRHCLTGILSSAGDQLVDSVTVSDCWDYGLYLLEPFPLTNMIVDHNNIGVYVHFLNDGEMYIYNSTVDSNGSAGIRIEGDNAAINYTVNVINCSITNNQSYGLMRADDPYGSCSVKYSNVWDNYETDTPNVYIQLLTCISQDPLYTNPGEDYSLLVPSPCIDGGTNTGAPDHDALDHYRPVDGTGNGAVCDIGAFEWIP